MTEYSPNNYEELPPSPPFYRRAYQPWYQKGWGLVVIFFLILMIGGVVILGWVGWQLWGQIDLSTQGPEVIDPAVVASASATKDARRQALEQADRPYLGNLNAKLVIVEFSDFQCPYCTDQFPIIRELTNTYRDDVLFIYRQFPIINEDSIMISEAALCAHDQGKFWPFHDRLFISHDQLLVDAIAVIALSARQAGLNIDMFESCLNEHRFRSTVISDAEAGVAAGVEGTPTFFVNGHKISGPVSRDKWKEIIEGSIGLIEKEGSR